ncbi:MAG: twin-arginine translocase subunit TatC [Rikenellaceae bacterium]|nr:twin-arginine translocase subunit TatC [Rikenellaceae bacterium]
MVNTRPSNGDSPEEMTFFEHLDALRPHLLRSLASFFILTVAAFFCKDLIIDKILFGPQSPEFITNRILCQLAGLVNSDALCLNGVEYNLINTKLSGQFMLHLTVSVASGLIIAVPYIIHELWQFVKPALSPNERRGSRRLVGYVSLCFFAGILFGYYIIAPITISFFQTYTVSESITNLFDISSYLATVLNVTLACGAVFQLPILIYFLSKTGVVSSGFLKKYRKHAAIFILIFAALITPPDIFSQILIGIPMYLLYELSINIAGRTERKRK